MNLDETQRKKLTGWIDEGLKLSEIQKKLETECGLRMTYLDLRLVVDELKLKPKDPTPPPKPAEPVAPEPTAPEPGTSASKVAVSVDQLTRPGALVSGKVTFSDGKTADWILDQAGRLGVVPAEKGYKPSQTDLQEFQAGLQNELQKLGM